MKRLLLFTLSVAILLIAACSKHKYDPPRQDIPGSVGMSIMPKWLELPEVSYSDGYDYFYHGGVLNGKAVRNWSFYWDYDNLISRWVAYPLHKGIYEGASRSEAWGVRLFSSGLKAAERIGGYKDGNNGWYSRGQLIPSSDRAGDELNKTTFYSTNIVPVNSDFQDGTMRNLEEKIRSWAGQSDTCYVVSGCICKEAKYYVFDRSSNKITVPDAFFKAVLRYCLSLQPRRV